MVEPQPSKLKTRVRFPSPALNDWLVSRSEGGWSRIRRGMAAEIAAVAQLVERVLGKDEVTGPSPVSSSVERTSWGGFARGHEGQSGTEGWQAART
jgi:hypothetical protein